MKPLSIVLFLIITLNSFSQIQLSHQVDSIPMRDGKMLAADFYVPDTSKTYPVILVQTPYNRQLYRYSLPLIGRDLANSQFAFVIVDWRCFYGSKAACKLNPDRGKDGYDVIDWIVKQKWSNGKVGTWGPSALGKIQYQTAKEQHPNHICAVPIVAAPQYKYEEFYPEGVYRTEYVEQLDALGYGMSTFLKAHPYYDATWQYLEKETMYPDEINIPMLMIGGWFDHNTDLMFEFFDTLIKASPANVREQHKFLVGPWAHGSVGKKKVGDLEFPNAEGMSDSFAMMFFDYHLLGAKNGWPIHHEYIFHILAAENFPYSSRLQQFPKSMYDEYRKKQDLFSFYHNDSMLLISDPKNPSPTYGGATLRLDLEQGPKNLSNVIIPNDTNIVLALRPNGMFGLSFFGKSKLKLYVKSDRKDIDIAARLALGHHWSNNDMHIISEGITRARFREGFKKEDEKLLTPGEITYLEIEFPPLFLSIGSEDVFLYIILSGANYPRYDVNLNNGEKMYVSGDSLVATNYIYANHDYPLKFEIEGGFYFESIEKNTSNNFKIYPNPISKILQFESEIINQKATIEIVDLEGRIFKSHPHNLSKSNQMNIEDLSSGVYVLKIFNEDFEEALRFVKK